MADIAVISRSMLTRTASTTIADGCIKCNQGFTLANGVCQGHCGDDIRDRSRVRFAHSSSAMCDEREIQVSHCVDGTYGPWIGQMAAFPHTSCTRFCPDAKNGVGVAVGHTQTRLHFGSLVVSGAADCVSQTQVRTCVALPTTTADGGVFQGQWTEWSSQRDDSRSVDDFKYAQCTRMCNPGCFPDFLEDTVCQPSCNTAACGFDGGMCAAQVLTILADSITQEGACRRGTCTGETHPKLASLCADSSEVSDDTTLGIEQAVYAAACKRFDNPSAATREDFVTYVPLETYIERAQSILLRLQHAAQTEDVLLQNKETAGALSQLLVKLALMETAAQSRNLDLGRKVESISTVMTNNHVELLGVVEDLSQENLKVYTDIMHSLHENALEGRKIAGGISLHLDRLGNAERRNAEQLETDLQNGFER